MMSSSRRGEKSIKGVSRNSGRCSKINRQWGKNWVGKRESFLDRRKGGGGEGGGESRGGDATVAREDVCEDEGVEVSDVRVCVGVEYGRRDVVRLSTCSSSTCSSSSSVSVSLLVSLRL